MFRLYGRLPNKKDLIQNKLKVYFLLVPQTTSSPLLNRYRK